MGALIGEWLTRTTKLVLYDAAGEAHVITSYEGADMGCPGSPPIFAIALNKAIKRIVNRIKAAAAESTEEGGAKREDLFSELWSFLDDVILSLPSQVAQLGFDIAVEELRRLGLDINVLKSKVHGKKMRPEWSDTFKSMWSKEGLIICGTPWASTGPQRALQNEEEQDADNFDILRSAWPLGKDNFVEAFVGRMQAKLQLLVTKIVDLPTHASANKPALQSAHVLLRQAVRQKVAHLYRVLPPNYTRRLAAAVGSMIYNAWRALTGAEEDTWELRSFLQLASKEGGGSLSNAEDTIEAAYIAGCLEAAKHVKENVGKSQIEKEEFWDAVKSLKDKYDIDLWKVIQSEPERAGGRRWKTMQTPSWIR